MWLLRFRAPVQYSSASVVWYGSRDEGSSAGSIEKRPARPGDLPSGRRAMHERTMSERMSAAGQPLASARTAPGSPSTSPRHQSGERRKAPYTRNQRAISSGDCRSAAQRGVRAAEVRPQALRPSRIPWKAVDASAGCGVLALPSTVCPARHRRAHLIFTAGRRNGRVPRGVRVPGRQGVLAGLPARAYPHREFPVRGRRVLPVSIPR